MKRVIMMSSKKFEREAFLAAGADSALWRFEESALSASTASLCSGYPVVCLFVTDKVDAECARRLREGGVETIALRSAGFNNIDLDACRAAGIRVARVPRYSPQAVAEFAVGLYLSLNRKIHRAHNRVREGNFSLEGLVGRDVWRQTMGIVGTGNIGKCAARIFRGFGSRVLAYDVHPDAEWAAEFGVEYVAQGELWRRSDVISLHVPLMPATKHMLNASTFASLKPGAYLVNTSRGGLVESRALITALKSGRLAGAALDVYEEEEGVFFTDHSESAITDDVLARLMTFPNVLITSHQAFLTADALNEIARVTLDNIARAPECEPGNVLC